MFESLAALDAEVQAAYLARLGIEAEPPSAHALRLLVQRHTERVPYETLWMQSGETWDIDPAESARRIAYDGRGGYCYHLNGALGLLLHTLGYDVRGHVGGVLVSDEPDPQTAGNHLVLTVRGLPSDVNPAGLWYVDDGLGDALHEPLPLATGQYVQHPFRLTLSKTGDTGWHLTHDEAGGFAAMSWTNGTAQLRDFQTQHAWLSRSPDSPFVQVPMAESRDARGVDVIRGLVFSRIGEGGHTGEPVTGEREWFGLLADVFGLRFDASPAGSRERLWSAVLTAHRRWEARQSG